MFTSRELEACGDKIITTTPRVKLLLKRTDSN